MHVGVVGHRCLSADATAFAGDACGRLLGDLGRDDPRLTAVSALAEGADTLFASAALTTGVPLEVVQPHDQYLDDFPTTTARALYTLMWASAQCRTALPYGHRSVVAYRAAMRWVVDRSHVLIAIWDGRPSASIAGTAQTVMYARKAGCPIVHVQPEERRVSFA